MSKAKTYSTIILNSYNSVETIFSMKLFVNISYYENFLGGQLGFLKNHYKNFNKIIVDLNQFYVKMPYK